MSIKVPKKTTNLDDYGDGQKQEKPGAVGGARSGGGSPYGGSFKSVDTKVPDTGSPAKPYKKKK